MTACSVSFYHVWSRACLLCTGLACRRRKKKQQEEEDKECFRRNFDEQSGPDDGMQSRAATARDIEIQDEDMWN